jgi:hypothetical protein
VIDRNADGWSKFLRNARGLKWQDEGCSIIHGWKEWPNMDDENNKWNTPMSLLRNKLKHHYKWKMKQKKATGFANISRLAMM